MHKLIILLAVFLASCTGATTERVVVEPAPNSCQVTEVRPTSFSTLVLGICWDQAGEPIGMVGAGGQPVASVALTIVGAGAMVGSAYMVGGALSGLKLGIDVPVALAAPH